MGTTKRGTVKILAVITAIAVLCIAQSALAIEQLQISVQCTNVVLRWPCLDDGSEQFFVQYRSTLSPTDSWQTLETSLPATYGTNEMYYTNWGVVLNPVNCDGGGGFFSMGMMTGGSEMSLSPSSPEPMATLNGTSNTAPVKLYPEGFDFSNFTITVPGTAGSLSGSQFMAADAGSPIDPNGGTNNIPGSDTNSIPPDVGFYRVVRNGAHLFGVTNGTVLSGTVNLPVELANSDGTVSSLSLTENDAPIGNSVESAPLSLPLALVVDTTLMSNGVHMVSASARWDDTNGNVWEAVSPAISVTVSNEISFPNWMPEFGELDNSLLIRATSVHTNTDWLIDVYDSSNIYIGTFGGHTDDGDIYVVWNLVGPDSVAHTNDNFFNFYITTEYVDPPTPPTYRQSDPWLGNGAWCEVLQHAFDYLTDSQTLYQEMNGFVNAPGAVGANLYPPASSDGSPYALTFGAENPQGDTDWRNFRSALYNPLTHNLVYFGHGGPTGLGQNIANTNRFISATEIGNVLHTIPAGQTNRHNFRFVFVDACSTGKGSLCKAFGIRDTENVPDIDYINASMRRSCYVGWPTDKAIGFNFGNTVNYDHVNFIEHIQTQLFFGDTIRAAVDTASRQPDVGVFLNNNLKIYGSWNVTLGSDNR
jgi:hypothetical protein